MLKQRARVRVVRIVHDREPFGELQHLAAHLAKAPRSRARRRSPPARCQSKWRQPPPRARSTVVTPGIGSWRLRFAERRAKHEAAQANRRPRSILVAITSAGWSYAVGHDAACVFSSAHRGDERVVRVQDRRAARLQPLDDCALPAAIASIDPMNSRCTGTTVSTTAERPAGRRGVPRDLAGHRHPHLKHSHVEVTPAAPLRPCHLQDGERRRQARCCSSCDSARPCARSRRGRAPSSPSSSSCPRCP